MIKSCLDGQQQRSHGVRTSRRPRGTRWGVILVASLTGCAVGGDFTPPAPPKVEHYTREPLPSQAAAGGAAPEVFDSALDVPARWWTVFGSQRLDELVEQALVANPTIASAEAALKIAHENVIAQRGFFYPTVQAQYSPSRQRNAVGTIAPTLASNVPVYSLYTAQLGISYAPDVFGLNRRQVESLVAQEEQERDQLRAARVTLANNVVAAAMQRAMLEAQVQATRSIIAAEADALSRLKKQLETGYAGRLDVAAQEAALAQAESSLPPLERQLEQTRDLLSALVRNDPSQALPEISLDEFTLPQSLPLSLPSRLVEQRPDVHAAMEQLHAATAQFGVATADLLPQLAINATYGGVSTSPGDMFRPDNIFWSLVGSATQTLFDGGTLLARRRAAEAGVDQALAQYRTTVVQALQNVADTLYALDTDSRAMQAAIHGEDAARISLDLTRVQVDTGYANYLAFLSAEQTYQQAVLIRLSARGTWLGDTAALFQALGGGWWNTADPPTLQARPADD